MARKKNTVKKLAKNFKTKSDPEEKRKARKKAETTTGVELIKALSEEERNALYVLDRDDTGHTFSDLEKKFITQWVEFKNLVVVSSMLGISQKDSSVMLADPHIRLEIDRISQARMKFRFARRILTLDECESYLTTTITDEGVPLAEQLSSKDKLSAMKLLLEVKDMKAQGFANPTVIDNTPVEQQLEQLSVETIKQLIDTKLDKPSDITNNIQMRQELVSKIPDLSEKEKNDIMSMSPDEILKLLDNMNK